MSNHQGDLAYKKAAQTLGIIAFLLYFFSLPYVLIVATNLNSIALRWVDEVPWYDLFFCLFIVNLPPIALVVGLGMLVVLGLMKKYKGVLFISVVPALILILCISVESISRLIL